ncbi:LacI family DNA-binding transcriptional regulator [Microbacterium sp. ZW T5_45]|uniref:LacI family DNA-binding transcriptional regulator n=1 Tax=Microbacterium sp. ZW T5_45 TaxID=3378080 RepID=UPI0038526AB3
MDEVVPRARRVSMTDVARIAGVSQKTVSRVINDEPYVTDSIRERVLAVVEQVGFRPNAAARALVTQRSRRIGVVALGGTAFYGPSSVLAEVEAVSRKAGYALSVVRTDPGAGADIQAAIDTLAAQGAEGIVISEPVDFGKGLLTVPDGIEVLTFGMRPVTSSPRELIIGADESSGARDATEHLLVQGHATVHHIAGPMNWQSSRSRRDGWRRALDDEGVSVVDPAESDWTPSGGYDAMRALLSDAVATGVPCTAVFVANDQMAIGAMAAIRDAGLRVPHDVAIIGFDDIDVAAFQAVPLSTVRQNFAETSRIGMHRLLRALDGHAPGTANRKLQAQLIIRESSQITPAN